MIDLSLGLPDLCWLGVGLRGLIAAVSQCSILSSLLGVFLSRYSLDFFCGFSIKCSCDVFFTLGSVDWLHYSGLLASLFDASSTVSSILITVDRFFKLTFLLFSLDSLSLSVAL